MSKIIIIGGKGTAVNIAEQITEASRCHSLDAEVVGFAIDDESLGQSIYGFPVVCKTHEARDKFAGQDVQFIFSLYKPECMRERAELLRSYRIPSDRFYTFVHPLAYVSSSATLGVGNVILSNTTVQAGARIGDYNIINSNVVVEHEADIGSNNFIAASVCIGARVQIGAGVFVGLKSGIREDLTVGDFSFVGMCSNVLSDVRPGHLVFGNPAKVR